MWGCFFFFVLFYEAPIVPICIPWGQGSLYVGSHNLFKQASGPRLSGGHTWTQGMAEPKQKNKIVWFFYTPFSLCPLLEHCVSRSTCWSHYFCNSGCWRCHFCNCMSNCQVCGASHFDCRIPTFPLLPLFCELVVELR